MPTTEHRALMSGGTSADAIYRAVARTVRDHHPGGGMLLDMGCGTGGLREYIRDLCDIYVGADVVRHEGFPDKADFRPVDLDSGRVDLPSGTADVIVCVETIEHLENPRALFRELARIARPGGLIVVTTPNQVSWLSKLGLLVKGQFPAFQERPGLYPAHITALLPVDLLRMAKEVGLVSSVIRYTDFGRIPGSSWHWPKFLAGRAFSDNVLLMARRP
jgi:2-polyprenyl-3-methyl-5-hydroxy-6-metoxy-1,4-benzoquinol methylase